MRRQVSERALQHEVDRVRHNTHQAQGEHPSLVLSTQILTMKASKVMAPHEGHGQAHDAFLNIAAIDAFSERNCLMFREKATAYVKNAQR